jgi:predicted O-methyltransferase YrrM
MLPVVRMPARRPLLGRGCAPGCAEEAGGFDGVYCNVDKDGYPDCWRAVRDRLRVGGLWLCDNTIWIVYIATGTDREGPAGFTALIREHNRLVADDTR